jgi:hypothetical protein
MRPANAASNSQSLQGADFGALLEQARSGNVESGVPIRVPKHLGLQLDQSQNDRLMKAMDQADMQGAGRALVLMDGMALTMDVGTRTVTGVVDAKSPGVLDGIDTVVVASQDPNAKPNDAKGARPLRGHGRDAEGVALVAAQSSQGFESRRRFASRGLTIECSCVRPGGRGVRAWTPGINSQRSCPCESCFRMSIYGVFRRTSHGTDGAQRELAEPRRHW